MSTHRLFSLLSVALLVLTGCAPVGAPAAVTSTAAVTPAANVPVSLRLAVSDDQGSPSEAHVNEFIQQVKTLSNGNITVEPDWNAGRNTQAGFEIGVVQLMKAGKSDLGLAGSRAFDNEGVTNLEALQAPFLITDDALAKAVATSDVAQQMLDSLTSSGLVGLTLWPEDLRHPFAITPQKPLLSPDDFAGLTIRTTTPAGISAMLVKAFGGKPMFEDTGYQGAESGLRQLASLSAGTPTATGNVTFFPKYQVLFGNLAALNKLTDAQRAILVQAARATQEKAIAEYPGEVEDGKAWCADGLGIVLASDQQVAAFETAAKPVLDQIQKDSLNAKWIAAIRDLKAKTPPAPGAAACASAAAQATPEATQAEVWSKGLPPNGVWQVNLTVDDFVRMGVPRSIAAVPCPNPDCWAPILYVISFKDGNFVFKGEDPKNPQGPAGGCQAHYELIGEDVVRLTYYQKTPQEDDCTGQVDEIQWRMDSDGLHLHLIDTQQGPLIEWRAFYQAKTWQPAQ